jgi:thioredoxin 1
MAAIPEVSDQTFKERVISSTRPVVVDFWAPWCMPCRMLTPILEKVAEKNAEKVDFYKLNTDENPQTSAQYRVMSIPSVVFFKGGQEVRRVIGVQQEGALQREIDTL